jgi:hypothetical protein
MTSANFQIRKVGPAQFRLFSLIFRREGYVMLKPMLYGGQSNLDGPSGTQRNLAVLGRYAHLKKTGAC